MESIDWVPGTYLIIYIYSSIEFSPERNEVGAVGYKPMVTDEEIED